jgi:hypothetical protein
VEKQPAELEYDAGETAQELDFNSPKEVQHYLETLFVDAPHYLPQNFMLILGLGARTSRLSDRLYQQPDRLYSNNELLYGHPLPATYVHFLRVICEEGRQSSSQEGNNNVFHQLHEFLYHKSNEYIRERVREGLTSGGHIQGRFGTNIIRRPRTPEEFQVELELYTHYKSTMFENGFVHPNALTLVKIFNEDVRMAAEDMFKALYGDYALDNIPLDTLAFEREILKRFCDSTYWQYELDDFIHEEEARTGFGNLRYRRIGKPFYHWIIQQSIVINGNK